MDNKLSLKDVTGDSYTTAPGTPGLFSRLFTSLSFYMYIAGMIWQGYTTARRGDYDKEYWQFNSQHAMDCIEKVGGIVEIKGLDNLRELDGPCVIVGNHMSTLETFTLPGILVPILDATFVVKESLTKMPVISNIICATTPIAVSRSNPRDDLKRVLEDGKAMLASGRSVVIFPQTTRANVFDPAKFNSIGAKLAARAGVPIIPLALNTSFWSNGRIIKDIGTIDTRKKVRFLFGNPIHIEGKGNAEHKQVVEFISRTLASWAAGDDS